MSAARIDKNSPVMVEAVMQGLGRIELPPRNSVVGALETLVQTGVLDRHGTNYKLTGEGELIVYPGTSQENIDSVAADLMNYMYQNDPERVFSLQAYRAQIRQRLNPREEAVVNQAVEKLVEDSFWTPAGRDSYVLAE